MQAAPAIMNLRFLNPYVKSSFMDWQKNRNLLSHAPRNAGPLSSVALPISPCAGTSSFGMSGVNAYGAFQVFEESFCREYRIRHMVRRWHWLLTPDYFLSTKARPIATAKKRTVVFLVDTDVPALAFLKQHAVRSKPILPAAALFDCILASVSTLINAKERYDVIVFEGMIPQAVLLTESATRAELSCHLNEMTGDASIQTGAQQPAIHFQATILQTLSKVITSSTKWPSKNLLKCFAGFERTTCAQSANFARVRSPQYDAETFVLHPALADASLHLLTLEIPSSHSTTSSIPYSIEVVSLDSRKATSEAHYPSSAIVEPDASCHCLLHGCWRVNNMKTKHLNTLENTSRGNPNEKHAMIDFLYASQWQSWLQHGFVCSERTAANAQRIFWRAAIEDPSIVTSTAIQYIQAAIEEAGKRNSIRPVSVDIANVPSYLQSPYGKGNNAKIATAGSLAVLTKVMATENPTRSIASIQRSEILSAKEFMSIPEPIDAYGTFHEAGMYLKATLSRLPSAAPTMAHLLPLPRGSISNMRLQGIRESLGDDDVCVTLQSIGLNFRDLLNILGMYPGDPGPPGADCAGFISSVGKKVKDLRPGDAVFGLIPGCIGPKAVSSGKSLVQKPTSITFAEAASIPTVYLTALMALSNFKDQQKILVHGGAGGVGSAVIDLAEGFRCQVTATAGNPIKRSHLRNTGTVQVCNSRNSCWIDEVSTLWRETAQIDNGSNGVTGFDTAISSLTSTGMVAGTLSVIRNGGFFIEISKRDIWAVSRMAQERPDVHYQLIAIDFLPPDELRNKLQILATLVAKGALRSSIGGLYSLGDISVALKRYSRTDHIGKIILNATQTLENASCQPATTIAIGGGTGALGSVTASWLIGIGQKNIILFGRSKGSLSETLSRNSAAVTVICCDTSSFTDCQRSLGRLDPGESPPLSMIINSAGIIRDAVLTSQAPSGIREVFAPKYNATIQMSRAARFQPLQQILLFSSSSSLFGSPGQGNYAAANAAVESFTLALCDEGTVARAIQWGAWELGMAARPIVRRRILRAGLGLLKPDQGLDALRVALFDGRKPFSSSSIVAALLADWSKIIKYKKTPPFFSEVLEDSLDSMNDVNLVEGKKTPAWNFRNELMTTGSLRTLISAISESISGIIGAEPDTTQPLQHSGVDSLTAVEIRNALNERFGVEMPVTATYDYPTVLDLAKFISGLVDTQKHEGLAGNNHEKIVSNIQDRISELVESIIGSKIGLNEPFMSNGLDSLGIVELRNKLNLEFGHEFAHTTAIDYPTIAALSAYIAETFDDFQLSGCGSKTDSPGTAVATTREFAALEDLPTVDLVKSACRPPSSYLSHSTIDSVIQVPMERWDMEVTDRTYQLTPRFGSFVDSIEKFDPSAFMISLSEAVWMDPQQRLLLESTAELIYLCSSRNQTAVMVGIGTSDFIEYSSERHLDTYFATGAASSVASGRLAFTYGLRGPCLSFDTACSSSLVATHYCLQDISKRTTVEALAAGINVLLSPKKAAAFNMTGMLSGDGRCKTLDASADGYVRAEACVVHLLKSSCRGKDNIVEQEAIIQLIGSAVNQDGRSSALTAPNGPSQQSVIASALECANMQNTEISSLELHGTGTLLGDPIEIGAIVGKLVSVDRPKLPLSLTSIKSLVGHAETAAGALGLLSASDRVQVASLQQISHLRIMNNYVGNVLEDCPMRFPVPRQVCPRQRVFEPRGHGISSFAFQGTNAHLILTRINLQGVGEHRHSQRIFLNRRRCWIKPNIHPAMKNCSFFRAEDDTPSIRLEFDLKMATYGWSNDLLLMRKPCLTPVLLQIAILSRRIADENHVPFVAVENSTWQQLLRSSSLRCIFNQLDARIIIEEAGTSSSLSRRLLFSASFVTVADIKSRRSSDREPINLASILYNSQRCRTMCANISHAIANVVPFVESPFAVVAGLCEHAAALSKASLTISESVLPTGSRIVLRPFDEERRKSSDFVTSSLDHQTYLHFCASEFGERFDGICFKPVPVVAEGQNGFDVLPRRKRILSSPLNGNKWLIVGLQEGLAKKVCTFSVSDKVHVLSVRHLVSAPGGTKALPSFTMNTEIVTSKIVHLHWALSNSAAEHLVGAYSESQRKDDNWNLKMDCIFFNSFAWLHAARDCSGTNAKLSIIIRDDLSEGLEIFPSKNIAVAIAVSKTRFMESRESHGLALLITKESSLNAQQLNWLLSSSGETSGTIKYNELVVERLVHMRSCPRTRNFSNSLQQKCCVIVGGTRGLGLAFARKAAKRGYERVILASKRGADEDQFKTEFHRYGADVFVWKCDSAIKEDCNRLLSRLREEMPAVQCFVHAAGVIGFHFLPDLTKESFHKVAAPKTTLGRQLFDTILPIESFSAFSSVASIWSQAGAAAYSAGNSYLNAIAQERHHAGLPGAAVALGPVGEVGMTQSLRWEFDDEVN